MNSQKCLGLQLLKSIPFGFHKANDGVSFSQNYDLVPFAFNLNTINEVVMKLSN